VPRSSADTPVSRILTTHVGSLPYVEPAQDEPEGLRRSVQAVVDKQRSIGLDIVNEGEYTKGGDWLSFVESRFRGFEERPPPPDEVPLIARGKDREEFAEFYAYAAERGTLFYRPGEQIRARRPYWVCTGPVVYAGQEELAREISLLKTAAGSEDVFLTSTAPASLEVYRQRVLPHRGGIRVRHRGGDARGVPGHRRGGHHSAG